MPWAVRSALNRTPVQDFNSFFTLFYFLISTSSQKIGDLFFPVIFLDFWTFAVWPHQDWETVIANDSMISDSKVYFALSVGCKTLHLRHSMLMSYYVDYGNMGYWFLRRKLKCKSWSYLNIMKIFRTTDYGRPERI